MTGIVSSTTTIRPSVQVFNAAGMYEWIVPAAASQATFEVYGAQNGAGIHSSVHISQHATYRRDDDARGWSGRKGRRGSTWAQHAGFHAGTLRACCPGSRRGCRRSDTSRDSTPSNRSKLIIILRCNLIGQLKVSTELRRHTS